MNVVAVHRDDGHCFSKPSVDVIVMRTGLGVEGDAHFGRTVQHLSRVRRDPSAPNLRQVHLIHDQLIDELVADGFTVGPGDMGENVTTRGVDLLALPTGTRLALGADALIEVTGLRNPCLQLDHFHDGLLPAVLDRAPDGSVIRKAGVMAVVLRDGDVRAGDEIVAELPAAPHEPLRPV